LETLPYQPTLGSPSLLKETRRGNSPQRDFPQKDPKRRVPLHYKGGPIAKGDVRRGKKGERV